MRAAYLTAPRALEIRDVPEPEPGPGEVVVAIRAALTCGTDLKAWRRGHPLMPFPTPLGHEFAGEVVAAGVGAPFAVGTPLMSVHSAPCGSCPLCARERENLCPITIEKMVFGAYAERFLVPAHVARRNAFVKPASLPWAEAALLEPLACAVHALGRVRIEKGATVTIVGAGAQSLLMLLLARARGAGRVVVAGRRPWRLERARDAGADDVVDTREEGALARMRAELVIECVGTPETWETAFRAVERGGTVLGFGGCAGRSEVRVDPALVHYDEVSLVGAFHFTPAAVAEARELLVDGLARRAPLLSGEVPLETLPETFRALDEGEAMKLVVVP